MLIERLAFFGLLKVQLIMSDFVEDKGDSGFVEDKGDSGDFFE